MASEVLEMATGEPLEAPARKPGTFAPGYDARRMPIKELVKRIKNKKVPIPIVANDLPDDGASQQLQDMRHVYLNHCNFDTTEAQRSQRAFKAKSPAQFNTLMAALERAHLEANSPSQTEGGRVPSAETQRDLGTEKCLELAERLLAELTKGTYSVAR